MTGAAFDEGKPVVLCDLDGVVWLSHLPIPGSVDAIATLRAAGHRVLFVTNNSSARVEAQEAALASIGIPATGDVLTSANAAALLISPGEKVMVCGGEGVSQAVLGRNAIVVDEHATGTEAAVDAVIVGFHRSFDYDAMMRASTAARNGARLIGTNDDATYPTPDGPIPGGGAILASIVTAAGVAPIIAGKPYEPMAALVRATVGEVAAKNAVMVGDRPSTDGLMAAALGCHYAHVESGITPPGSSVEPPPALVAADLAEVAKVLVAGGFPGSKVQP
ncbi:MAG TPA: HAD-IIA family hydrolase [Ilumatobacteraceae bacterium]|nr:HAD-IIA family hydrolase [Ilumatobacteraceae bacterium]